jgi:hypothetical protein
MKILGNSSIGVLMFADTGRASVFEGPDYPTNRKTMSQVAAFINIVE